MYPVYRAVQILSSGLDSSSPGVYSNLRHQTQEPETAAILEYLQGKHYHGYRVQTEAVPSIDSGRIVHLLWPLDVSRE